MEIEIGEKKIIFEIKNLAERANADVWTTLGSTQVLTTCVLGQKETEGLGFFPLTVNYEERYYAAGKILGSRYMRREGRPSDNATVIARIIDRTIRPLFPKGLKKEVQTIATCLSWDEENDPDVLGLLGASLALTISDIPFNGPAAGVRIGLKDEKLIINPTYDEREKSDLDIMFAGVKNNGKILINMVEASAEEVPETLILKALKKAIPEIKKLIEFQEEIGQKFGKEKIPIVASTNRELEKRIKELLGQRIEQILFPALTSADRSEKKNKDTREEGTKKAQKLDWLKKELQDSIGNEYPGKENLAKDLCEKEIEKLVQEKILKEEKRVDQRKLDEIREIMSEAGLIPRAHGSALFCRGATKSLSILTLGGPEERQLIEGMEIVAKKRFLHHYNFPPYSTGEVKPLTSPSRREIGHGVLVEKALLPLIPEIEKFPYTIRIVSEMLSSNGSTSMASVCSSSLALMDAGVPIKRAVAGIAIGLAGNEKNYKLLTDIQGPEDFFGNMDCKIAGTKEGITAIQMDVKIPGISEEMFKETLERGKKARIEILDLMGKTIENPRQKLSPFAPKILQLQIPQEKIGEVIGPKGCTIKKISEETGTEITIEPEGLVYITSENEEMAKKAMGIIKSITREIKTGETFLGTVKKILKFGVFLELEGGQEGMLPLSQTERNVRIGDKIPVKVFSIDELGRINLTLQISSPKNIN